MASRRQSTIWLKIEGNSIANKVKGRKGGRSRLKGTLTKGQMGVPTNSVTRRDETQVAHVYGQETSADGSEVRGVFRKDNGNGMRVPWEESVTWSFVRDSRSRPRLPACRLSHRQRTRTKTLGPRSSVRASRTSKQRLTSWTGGRCLQVHGSEYACREVPVPSYAIWARQHRLSQPILVVCIRRTLQAT